jgi:RNA polymerase sigma-70 factor (ECF subfamily)
LKQKSKNSGISSETLQNKTIDNLEADVFFGNEIQIKLQKQLRYCQKTTIGFKMKYFQELKYEEISEMGTSVGGLKASYHLAVKKIEAFVARN